MELKGKLEFISLWQPIRLFTEYGEIDLREHYFKLFEKLNGVKSKMDSSMNGIAICADENSESVIKFERKDDTMLILLKSIDRFGASNIGAYLPNKLQQLNARSVIVSVSENGISLAADPQEEVFGLYYTNNNCCKIPDDKVKTLCKVGTSDCCIFCSVSGQGFECLKFDTASARMLLHRHLKKEIRATRIGNCEVLGRKES